MNEMTANKKIQSERTSVSETAKKLHEDLRDRGHYDAARLKRVFGDPRKSVAVESNKEGCAAYLGRKRA